MNSEIKQMWVDALRSGDYQQGQEKLRSDDGFCCLGVLCDLYVKEKGEEWEFKGLDEEDKQVMDYWYFDGASEFLPNSVKEWAELSIDNPKVKVMLTGEDEVEWFYFDEVANLNDSGYSFNEIANLIENQL